MAGYTLYCFAQSGNAYKSALMLNLCAADWQPRLVDYFNGEQRTPAYRALNEMAEVPVLEHAGGRLSQTGVILDYLAQTFGRFGWADEDERPTGCEHDSRADSSRLAGIPAMLDRSSSLLYGLRHAMGISARTLGCRGGKCHA